MFDIDNTAAEKTVVEPKFDPREERKALVAEISDFICMFDNAGYPELIA